MSAIPSKTMNRQMNKKPLKQENDLVRDIHSRIMFVIEATVDIVAFIFTFGLLVWSFFNPSIASYVYIGFIVLFEGCLIITYFFGKLELKSWSEVSHNSLSFSASQYAAFRKYHLFFRFPGEIGIIHSCFPSITLSAFIWVPWLLFKHQWISAIFIGLNTVFVIKYLAIRCCDPRPYLEKVVNAGNIKYYDELKAVNSIYEELLIRLSNRM